MDSHKRNPNWTASEKEFAIEEIINRSDELFGKFRGATCGAKTKERCWQEIADSLNSSGLTACIRTVAELKKLFYNCKGKVKKKIDSVKKTGGGPLTVHHPCEDLIVQHWVKNNSAEATGISVLESVCQTVDASTAEGNQEKLQSADLSLENVETVWDNIISTYIPVQVNETEIIDSQPVPICNPTPSTRPLLQPSSTCTIQSQPSRAKKSTKRKRDSNEADLYNLEKAKILAETKKIEAETAYWLNKTKHDNELYLLKKQLVAKQIHKFGPSLGEE